MTLKISIIMAVYKEPFDWIKECIDSILNQTLDDFEFIIINDNPCNKKLDYFLKNFLKLDKRIKIIKNRKNIGLTKSLNQGLKIATGKYIARMDADDISFPKRLKKQFEFLEKNQNIFLVGSGSININSEGIKLNKSKIQLNNIEKKLSKKNCFIHSSVMFRNNSDYRYREKFLYAQDYDLFLVMLSNGKTLTNLNEILIKYRINENAISWSKSGKQGLFAEKAKEFYQQRLKLGKDNYEKFDSNEILNINIDKSNNNIVLEQEIKSRFKLNELKHARNFCKKYFNKFGYFNKIIIYYILSFFPIKIIDLIRTILY